MLTKNRNDKPLPNLVGNQCVHLYEWLRSANMCMSQKLYLNVYTVKWCTLLFTVKHRVGTLNYVSDVHKIITPCVYAHYLIF